MTARLCAPMEKLIKYSQAGGGQVDIHSVKSLTFAFNEREEKEEDDNENK